VLARRAAGLLVVFVFCGDVVLGNFAGCYFGLVGIGRAFDGVNDFGFETLAFGSEFPDAFRVGTGHAGEPLKISGLASGSGTVPRLDWQSDFTGATYVPTGADDALSSNGFSRRPFS
jgi:hypothetical protein